MSKIGEMDRDELEKYAHELKRKNKTLIKVLKSAEGYIEASNDTNEELLEKIGDTLAKDRPDVTHYDTGGVQEVMSELRKTVDDHNDRMEDLDEDKS